MNIIALSRSGSFENHLIRALGSRHDVTLARGVEDALRHAGRGLDIVLVHARSFGAELDELLPRLAGTGRTVIAIAADVPKLEEMLELSRHGVRAYFNSYMADVHYLQMLAILGSGQSWFAPQILGHALEIARRHLAVPSDAALEDLTPRQQEIARDVSSGLSNRQIAGARGISERTVKTHLTHIFKKLGVSSRHALGARLRRAPSPEPARGAVEKV